MRMKKMFFTGVLFAAMSLSSLVFGGDIQWINVVGSTDEKQAPEFAVTYSFKMMKYEVTVEQYCEFLNAVASKVDRFGLFSKEMQIIRSGAAFSYKYKSKRGKANHPITYINFYRAVRFANWIHNGKPSGSQDGKTTENGAYDLSNNSVKHNENAKVWIPTEQEWYKTAYYNSKLSTDLDKAVYWDFADKTTYASNKYPVAEPPPGGDHSANYWKKLEGTTPVGSYIQAYSGYGVFDMNGNVFEWTETDFKDGMKVIRGGAWNFPNSYAYRKKRTGARYKEVNAGYGFRLAGEIK